ncbi:MAG TPA: hypothetical protein VHN77_11485 [Phycisphaerales bacterium]|nr:hypothetical protein [Phycisphaerales bacterium]
MRLPGSVLIIVCSLNAGAPAWGQAFFAPVGIPSGASASYAWRMSDNGNAVACVVPGTAGLYGYGYAHRWSMASGLVDMGFANEVRPVALSDDGTTVVVNEYLSDAPLRWDEGSGPSSITQLDQISGISGDGLTLLGSFNGVAARWSNAGGLGFFATPANPPTTTSGSLTSIYSAIATRSAAFSTVDGQRGVGVYELGVTLCSAGHCNGPFQSFGSFVWDAANNTHAILAQGTTTQAAPVRDASSDLSFVLCGGNTTTLQVFGSGFQLQTLTFNYSPFAKIAGNGSIVVAWNQVWTQSGGIVPLEQFLGGFGVSFPGWSTLVVMDTDYSGTRFCGFGTDPQGRTQGWYATIPSPSASVLMGVFALRLLLRTRSTLS